MPEHKIDSAVRKLYRSRTNRYVGGVCGGLAEYFNIDVVVVRLLFVILTFAGGAGLIAYLAFLIISPENPDLTPPQAAKSVDYTGHSILIGAIFIIIGLVFLLENLDFWHFHWSFWWPEIFSWHLFLPGLIIVVGILVILKGLQKPAEETQKTGFSPESTAGPQAHKRLERIPSRKMLAGVCAGIADYFNVDPAFVRIGWVVLTVASFWFGGLIYLVLALFLPEAHSFSQQHVENNVKTETESNPGTEEKEDQ